MFKTGDWVILNNGGTYERYIYQIKKVHYIDGYSDRIRYSLEGLYKGPFVEEVLIPWQPKPRELCVFYNIENPISFRVAQFRQIGYGKGREGLYKDMQGNYFKYCVPYIGQSLVALQNKRTDNEMIS